MKSVVVVVVVVVVAVVIVVDVGRVERIQVVDRVQRTIEQRSWKMDDHPRCSTLRKRVLFHRGCSSVLVAVRLDDAVEEARSTSFEYRVALTLPRVSCSR